MNPGRLFRRTAFFWLALGLGAAWAGSLALVVPERWGAAWQALSQTGLACIALGWASLAGAERGMAILAGAQPLSAGRRRVFLVAAILWNISLVLHLTRGGEGTLLFAAALLLGLLAWTLPRPLPLSAAEAYALAAFAALPLGLAARAFLHPVWGVANEVTRVWEEGAFFGLWLVPLALAVVYHEWATPPIPCRGIAALGCATWIGAAGWAGAARLVGGPVPLWIGTVGTAASLLLLLPALAIAVSLAETGPARKTILSWGIGAFGICVTGYTLCALQAGAAALQFTFCETALADLGLFGFITVVLASRWSLSPAALWCGAGGLLLLLGAEATGGLLQALAQRDPHVPWQAITDLLHPFLVGRAAGYFLMLVALLQTATERLKK